MGTHFGTTVGGVAGILALEDKMDEEEEKKLAGEGKEATSTQTKLKVPQK